MDIQSKPIKSGFIRLDKTTGGFYNSDLILVGAWPSVGKTSFILSSIKELCLSRTAKPVFFSIEMSEKGIRQRLISLISGITLKDIRSGVDIVAEDIIQADELINEDVLLIDDSPVITIKELCDRALYCIHEEGCNIVFIDSLELIRKEDGNIPLQDQNYMITKELKALARKLDVPVVCSCRLSKRNRSDNSFLATETVFDDSDVAIAITSSNNLLDRRSYRRCEFVVAKNRNGGLGKVDVDFYFENCSFIENPRSFDEIALLDDSSVQKLLKKIDPKDLVKAMKNANEYTRNKIFINMTKYSVEMIKEDMEFMGPIPVEDARNAQKRILKVLCKLEDKGEITMPIKFPAGIHSSQV